MNNKRSRVSLIVVSVGATFLVASLSFPPWSYTFQAEGISQVRKPAGYAFLLNAPPPQAASMRFGIVLDWPRLGAQLLAIAVTTGAVWYVYEAVGRRRVE
jgi:hypothetical protein